MYLLSKNFFQFLISSVCDFVQTDKTDAANNNTARSIAGMQII